jgi:superoxide dismutase, Fe-Mn family
MTSHLLSKLSVTSPSPMVPACKLAVDANFGSPQQWAEGGVAWAQTQAQAQGGGAGWLLLVFQPQDGRLVHQWVPNQTQMPEEHVPLAAWDMTSHAHAAADALLNHTDWAQVYERYQHAVHAASEAFAATPDEVTGIADGALFDVRRAGVFEQATTMIPGARWRDPVAVSSWAKDLPKDRAVVVYCIYGHEVGRATALRLRGAGVNARYLLGGIDGWQAAGRAVMARPEPGEAAVASS